MVSWYLCPYELIPFRDSVARRCVMARHIPTVPNADGADWQEQETLGDAALVRVDAPTSVQATIAADPTCVLIPETGAVSLALETAIVALGFSLAEVRAAERSMDQIRALLLSAKSAVSIDQATGAVRIGDRQIMRRSA